MTTTTESAGHPEVAEISDLTEGLLSPSRTSDVRRHLDGCELCADVYASLEEIRGMLGTLPGPPRMPADIAGRIDAALAAEALLDSTSLDAPFASTEAEAETRAEAEAVPEPVSVSAATSSPAAARVSRETSPSSTARTATDRPAGHPRASTGPGRGGRLRGMRRRTTVLGAVFTAAALGLGSLLVYSLSDDSGGSTETSAGRQTAASSSFADEKLKGKVAELLAKNSVKSPGKTDGSHPSFDTRSSPESPGSKSPLSTASVDVPTCIQRGIGDGTPIAAEEGTYEGKKAYLVVTPHTSDATKVSAYVVDAACVGKSSPSKGKVLAEHSYPQG
ncbi:anti-sigma factor family protein [Streptomyces sp. NPDC087300]|uniref:anti-sigma factor family protein n=1 Tax=Streptomyces sp. NPDC087300 TaxID=3365780 RepID=UPI0038248B48